MIFNIKQSPQTPENMEKCILLLFLRLDICLHTFQIKKSDKNQTSISLETGTLWVTIEQVGVQPNISLETGSIWVAIEQVGVQPNDKRDSSVF